MSELSIPNDWGYSLQHVPESDVHELQSGDLLLPEIIVITWQNFIKPATVNLEHQSPKDLSTVLVCLVFTGIWGCSSSEKWLVQAITMVIHIRVPQLRRQVEFGIMKIFIHNVHIWIFQCSPPLQTFGTCQGSEFRGPPFPRPKVPLIVSRQFVSGTI